MTSEQERLARIAAERGEEILRLRSRVEELEGALKKAVANLSRVAVYDDADDDDTEAISARAAWNRDLDAIRKALRPTQGEDK